MEKNYTSSQPKPDKKNPSRKECEEIITRILNAEITERGRNMQFRNSRDFLPYFESLYPASDSLTKQVQRALRNLSLAKDSSGFLIINKNAKQIKSLIYCCCFSRSCFISISAVLFINSFFYHK